MFGFIIFTFILGTVIGSFLNVCVFRLQTSEPISHGRSHCPQCMHPLSPWDLVPILSYITLGGRCRYCRKPISARYPIVELLSGILFASVFVLYKLSWDTPVYWLFVSAGLLAAFHDLDTMIIPDRCHVLFLIAGMILMVLHPSDIPLRLIGMIAVALPLWLVAWLTKGIGYGDVKLMASAGLVLGWQNILLAMLIGAVTAAAVALPQLLSGKKKGKDEMPLGPYLVIGIFTAMLFGNFLISSYLSLFI